MLNMHLQVPRQTHLRKPPSLLSSRSRPFLLLQQHHSGFLSFQNSVPPLTNPPSLMGPSAPRTQQHPRYNLPKGTQTQHRLLFLKNNSSAQRLKTAGLSIEDPKFGTIQPCSSIAPNEHAQQASKVQVSCASKTVSMRRRVEFIRKSQSTLKVSFKDLRQQTQQDKAIPQQASFLQVPDSGEMVRPILNPEGQLNQVQTGVRSDSNLSEKLSLKRSSSRSKIMVRNPFEKRMRREGKEQGAPQTSPEIREETKEGIGEELIESMIRKEEPSMSLSNQDELEYILGMI